MAAERAMTEKERAVGAATRVNWRRAVRAAKLIVDMLCMCVVKVEKREERMSLLERMKDQKRNWTCWVLE